MLVSAISTINSQLIKSPAFDSNLMDVPTNNKDNNGNGIKYYNDKLSSACLYNNINEWKMFCQRQISDGKLNVIA